MLTAKQAFSGMCALSPFFWVKENKIRLGGATWALRGHEYQVDMFEDMHPRQCDIKGAQMGVSETHVLKTFWGHIFDRYKTGSLYLFPTRDDVADFSKSRFNPLIDNNPCIGSFVQSTDSTNIKRIHKGFLYLRGTRSSSQLKSIPVDRIVFDELDEMDDDKVELAKERISHSDVQELIYLSTPTYPGDGIDLVYQNSDQRVWMIKCKHCGKETCLELEFPECLKEIPGKYSGDGMILNLDKAGKVYRACIHCHKEIFPRNGQWVIREPKNSDDMHGRWISQLNSIYIDPGYILQLFNDPPHGNLSEVYNSKLGMAYVDADKKLAKNQVLSLCGQDALAVQHTGPCAAGVDVGKILNVVIGCKPTNKMLKIVKVAELSTFNDVRDLFQRFNVKCAVFDKEPETRTVRQFGRENTQFGVYMCDYQEHLRGFAIWDENKKEIVVNRTEICDATHELFTDPGAIEIPRRCTEIDRFAAQMSNIVKALVETDEDTGKKEYRYKKTGGPDHYRHAANFFVLASEKIGLTGTLGKVKAFMMKNRNRSWMSA